jgi:hypothetical protein
MEPLNIRMEPLNIRMEPLNIRMEPLNIRMEPLNIRMEPLKVIQMKTKVGYRVDTSLKNDYDDLIIKEYGHKQNRCGLELGKALKTYLTLKGEEKYVNDPDVQELLEAAKKTPCTLTHSRDDDLDRDFNPNLDDDEYLDIKFLKAVDTRFDEFEKKVEEKIDEKLDIIEHNLQKKFSYNLKHGNKQTPLELFMAAFLDKYGEWNQVSYNELSTLAVQIHGVSDKRSIKNRINYLLGKGVIKEFMPNIYDVIHLPLADSQVKQP